MCLGPVEPSELLVAEPVVLTHIKIGYAPGYRPVGRSSLPKAAAINSSMSSDVNVA
jgi:hypothetical protein